MELIKNLEGLIKKNKLNNHVILWGISGDTDNIISCLNENSFSIDCILDNFKYNYMSQYCDIPISDPYTFRGEEKSDVTVIMDAKGYAEQIGKQLIALGFTSIYNLRNLDALFCQKSLDIVWHFIDRSQSKKNLCYILAGYETLLWSNTLKRIELFQSKDFDYCIVSSGKYVDEMAAIAERNNWSYLYTETNQVCFIQNMVVKLHPSAEYILKMDEDIFVSEKFFDDMLLGYKEIEMSGEYMIGCVVPVLPINVCGYVSYLKLSGNLDEYEKKFGRAYRQRFSTAIFDSVDTSKFLWKSVENFDVMANRFRENKSYEILHCYYNIGCIMFSRKRWMMMGMWPEIQGESGMGTDERYLVNNNNENDMPIYELHNVLAGHMSFGHHKKEMWEFYKEHPHIFKIKEE